MLIKQIYQKNVIFVTICILKILVLNMNLILKKMLAEFIFGDVSFSFFNSFIVMFGGIGKFLVFVSIPFYKLKSYKE